MRLVQKLGQVITTAYINQYIEKRKLECAENGTINRELAALRRMFYLAARCTPPKLYRVPTFSCLPENNVRMGYISDPDYDKLIKACPDLWLRTILAIGCTYGWRKQEILKLRVRQVDLFSRKITLNPGTTKNREGRVAPVTDELFPLLGECIAGKGPDDYVLTREGKPVRDFRKAWDTLFKRAGVEHRIIHDMRRTGAMNLDRSGISRTVAKQIGGWKTDSIYERYRIVSEADLQDAGKKLDRRNGNGHSTGIVEPRVPQTNSEKSVSVI
jgi:integrase